MHPLPFALRSVAATPPLGALSCALSIVARNSASVENRDCIIDQHVALIEGRGILRPGHQ